VLAVGEYLFGEMDERLCRLACGFRGGMGMSHQELCGALAAGVLLTSALYGRTALGQDDSVCQRTVARYLEQSARELGAARCANLKAIGYGSKDGTPCSILVERAVHVFFACLPQEATAER
jgi:Putative redox-active protein (C_GCAxxG_C_C)